uniref:Uncharacterized protein n=1 Tax=Parascaris univalens TaxID=6257 RepID=A0A915CJZ9_PARUN
MDGRDIHSFESQEGWHQTESSSTDRTACSSIKRAPDYNGEEKELPVIIHFEGRGFYLFTAYNRWMPEWVKAPGLQGRMVPQNVQGSRRSGVMVIRAWV